ncbi:MAG: glycoside hydrolase family 2 protein, partial [Gemmatimonadota bacterium]
ELELSIPAINVDISAENDGARLTFLADVLAKDVYLTLGDARFSDNFFDLLPGRPYRVFVQTGKALEEIGAELQIRTLAEVPTEGTPVQGGEGEP